MRIFANIKPTLKFTGQISQSNHARQYTSLVQILQFNRQCNNEHLRIPFSLRKLYNSGKTFDKTNDKRIEFKDNHDQNVTSIIPVALIDLNPLSSSSTKVLLIPLNWHDGNEMTMRNTISSIFARPKTIRQIEAFSNAVREGPMFKKERMESIAGTGEEQVSSNHQEYENSLITTVNTKRTNLSMVPYQQTPRDSSSGILGKDIQKLAGTSLSSAVLSKTFKGLSDYPTKLDNKSCLDLVPYKDRGQHNEKGPPLTTSLIMKMGALKINFDEFIWQSRFMYDPLSPIARTYSTMFMRTRNHKKDKCSLKAAEYICGTVMEQKIKTDISGRKSMAHQFSTTTQVSTDCVSHSKSVATANFGSSLRQISRDSASQKVYFNSPFVLELLGGQKFPMSCDTYRKALIEADKRRSALKKSSDVKRPKDCTANCHLIMTSSHVPVIREVVGTPNKIAKSHCKKADSCTTTECRDLLKEEIERLRKLEKEERDINRNKVSNGSVSQKCRKDDPCTKQAEGQKASCEYVEMSLRPLTPTIQSAKCDSKCQKGGSGRGTAKRCSVSDKGGTKSGKIKTNPCKNDNGNPKKRSPCDDVEKEYKPKCNTGPCGSESPQNPKTDPCKKPDNVGSKKNEKKIIDPCAKKDSNKNDKGETYPCTKEKKEQDPCTEQPKKNSDSCSPDKTKSDPCSNKDDKKIPGPCAKTNENCPDPCKKPGSGKKKIEKNKSGTCQTKKKDRRGKHKKPDPCTQRKGPCAKDKKTLNAGTKQENKKVSPCDKDKKTSHPCSKNQNPSDQFEKNKKQIDHCSQNKNAKQENTNPCTKQDKNNTTLRPCASTTMVKEKTKDPCGNQPKPTKPNCKPQGTSTRKCFSTSAICPTKTDTNIQTFFPEVLQKRHYLRNMSMNKNLCCFDFMRHFSSKGKKSKNDVDHGIRSKCKSLALKTPPNRRKDQDPQTKDGLRMCYPSYDMECPKKLCKNPRQTACSKYAFLKDTDNNKRKIKK